MGRYANNKPDGACLDAQLEAGLLYDVSEKESRPGDVIWDLNYQWDGYASEVDTDWFEVFRRSDRKCNGTAYIRDESGMYIVDNDWMRLTRPCLSIPIRGGTV